VKRGKRQKDKVSLLPKKDEGESKRGEAGSLKGRSPLKNNSSPSPFKERGIQGVRSIKISVTEVKGEQVVSVVTVKQWHLELSLLLSI
jgi:hypothetical protein